MLRNVHSITLKVLGIGALALLMLIPLAHVQGLISERSGLRDQAVETIASRWGAAQTIGGVVLTAPAPYQWTTEQGVHTGEDTAVFLPGQLDVTASLAPQLRRYGIYETPVYEAQVALTARFEERDLAALRRPEESLVLDRMQIRLPIADVRGLREVASVKVNGEDVHLSPGETIGGYRTVAFALDRKQLAAPLTVTAQFMIAGTERIQFLPLARTTTLKLDAPWGDPSFIGGFLPAKRDIEPGRFVANWQVLELNRGFGQSWKERTFPASALAESAFGAALFQPAGVYQRNERAGKYGLLFVGLTFVAFFLFEVLKRLRVHPVQYLLVGLSLCTFYVVLLALSEQIGFAPAYACAAGAVVLMVGGYAAAVLTTRRAGAMLGGSLALVYALLYGLVVSEQYSLLIGAFALLAVVALLMFLTRNVDWYGQSLAVDAAPAQNG